MFKRFRDRRVDEDTRIRYRENFLSEEDFILPLFLLEGKGREEKIDSMPGVYRYSLDRALLQLPKLIAKGLHAVILFGVPDEKGLEQAFDSQGLVQQAVRKMKSLFPELKVITDVCICSYSLDGHCHIGDNDETCKLLAKIAVSHAEAGADAVAPSDMMDGRVFYMREALDEHNLTTPIISYAAKFASAFYGPFRDAADCAPSSGNRKTYQMDPANGNEAIEEIAADIEEGAEAIIVKPALAYLDVVRHAKDRWPEKEIIVYNVSGEYSMMRGAVDQGILGPDAITEMLLSFKRAGADRIISYFTPEMLNLRDSNIE